MTRNEVTRFVVDLRLALQELFPRAHCDWTIRVQARVDGVRPGGENSPKLEINLRSPESVSRLEIQIDERTRVGEIVDRIFDETVRLDMGDLKLFDLDR